MKKNMAIAKQYAMRIRKSAESRQQTRDVRIGVKISEEMPGINAE